MKFVFRVTLENIQTLLNGKDFDIIPNGIKLADGKKLHYLDFNTVLVSLKYGYVAFTQYQSECEGLQKQIQDIYKRSEELCKIKPLS